MHWKFNSFTVALEGHDRVFMSPISHLKKLRHYSYGYSYGRSLNMPMFECADRVQTLARSNFGSQSLNTHCCQIQTIVQSQLLETPFKCHSLCINGLILRTKFTKHIYLIILKLNKVLINLEFVQRGRGCNVKGVKHFHITKFAFLILKHFFEH